MLNSLRSSLIGDQVLQSFLVGERVLQDARLLMLDVVQ